MSTTFKFLKMVIFGTLNPSCPTVLTAKIRGQTSRLPVDSDVSQNKKHVYQNEWNLQKNRRTPSGKVTWQWNIPMFKRKYIFRWSIFYCYVRVYYLIHTFDTVSGMVDPSLRIIINLSRTISKELQASFLGVSENTRNLISKSWSPTASITSFAGPSISI